MVEYNTGAKKTNQTKPNQTRTSQTKVGHLSMVEYDTGANNLAQNLSKTRVQQQPGEDGTADYKW